MNTFLQFSLFLVVSLSSFTLPGIYLLRKNVSLNFIEKIILGSVIGFVIFTLLAYVLGNLKLSFLLILLVMVIDFFSIKNILASQKQFTLLPTKQLLILILVFILGIAGQMAIVAPSGTYQGKDLVFWSSNGHDGPWHISLIEAIKRGYPLQNPLFAGEKLVNYHFFSDIALAELNRSYEFSTIDVYFRFFPLVFSFLLGSTAYMVGRKIGGEVVCGIWSTFFVYFAGSFGYIVTWLQSRSIGGESIFWATQIQSSVGNPPQIISNILILTFIYLFILYLSKREWYIFCLSIILLGTLAVFKIYASIVVLGSLGIIGVIQLVKERKFSIIFLVILSLILTAFLYIPNAANTTSFLIWQPWWFIRTMLVDSSRLNWLDLELKRQTYISENNWKRVVQIEITGFLIFFFGNLGTRFIGLYAAIKFLKDLLCNYLYQLFILIIIISLTLPLLFLQKGVAGNTSQFLQYFLLLFGVLAALSITQIQNKIKHKLLKNIFILLIILVSIPTQIGLLYDFYHKPPLAKITSEEIQALNFLRENTNLDSIILTPPYNKYLTVKEAVPDIWVWFDTAYVAAFSARRTYLADSEQVDIMGYDLKKRLDVKKNIFSNIDNGENMRKILQEEKIDYVYFPKPLRPKLDLNETNLMKVFDNGKIEIWKIY